MSIRVCSHSETHRLDSRQGNCDPLSTGNPDYQCACRAKARSRSNSPAVGDSRRGKKNEVNISRSLGPGAKPPVTVASTVLVSKNQERCRPKSIPENVGTQACTLLDRKATRRISGMLETFIGTGRKNDVQQTAPPCTRHRNGRGMCSSRCERINTDEEFDTLPETLNMSDECTPEGASTGRYNYEGANDSDESHACSSTTRVRGVGSKRSNQRYANANEHGDPTSSVYGYIKDEKKEGDEQCNSSMSDQSCHLFLSSSERNSSPFVRRAFRPHGPITRSGRERRIVPYEAKEATAAKSDRRWGPRRVSYTSYRQRRSPQPPRRLRGASKLRRRRQNSFRRSLDQKSGVSEEDLVPNGKVSYNAEVARLTRENSTLKQLLGLSRLSPNCLLEGDIWRTSPGGAISRAPPSDSRRRQVFTLRNRRRRCWSLTLDDDNPPVKIQKEGRTTLASPSHSVLEVGWELKRRPRSVSMGYSPPHKREAMWNANLEGGIDIALPRLLVEGGFLWKFPFHSLGSPRRRWFQIKPTEGLRFTSRGRVVRPAATQKSVGCSANGAFRDLSKEEECNNNASLVSIPIVNIRAAWPLTLLWADPQRDLQKFPPREMGIDKIIDIVWGHKTPAFWQQASHRGVHTLPTPALCFSIIGDGRTLDLASESLAEARQWIRALSCVARRVAAPTESTITSQGRGPAKYMVTDPERFELTGTKETYFSRSLRPDVTAKTSLVDELLSQQQPSIRVFDSHREKPVDVSRSWSYHTISAWRRQLFPAVSRGEAASVIALFEQGCPVDLVQTRTGETVLLLACRLGDVALARECLRRGSRNGILSKFGQTALHAAVAAGKESCVRLLLETAASSHSDSVVSNHRDLNNETPLHVASRCGFRGIADLLLHHGADLRLVDWNSNTPLHVAAGTGHTEVLASLLDAGGDTIMEDKNKRGNRALHVAAVSGHLSCVQLLLGTAAEPDIPNEEGNTPFTLASIGGHLAVTKLIRQYSPVVGTTSGGSWHVRKRGLASGTSGESVDILPRPYTSGSSLTRRPISPEHHPSRDLRQRYSSAARSSLRQAEPVEVLSSEIVFSKTAHKKKEERVTSSRPPVYGSLFDGLHVYVAGNRQPLGSQSGCDSIDSILSAGNSITTVTSTGCHDHSSQWRQPSSHDSRAPQTKPLEAMTMAMKWENVPAACSKLEYCPPHRVCGPPGCENVPGVNKSERFPKSFSSFVSKRAWSEALTSAKQTGPSSEDGAVGARGSWMIHQDEGTQNTTGIRTSDMHLAEDVGGGDNAFEVLAEAEIQPLLSGHALKDDAIDKKERETTQQRQKSFVISSPELNGLSGLWHILYSEGYPYYVHQISGHSQWEDPRYDPKLQRLSKLQRSSTSPEPTPRKTRHHVRQWILPGGEAPKSRRRLLGKASSPAKLQVSLKGRERYRLVKSVERTTPMLSENPVDAVFSVDGSCFDTKDSVPTSADKLPVCVHVSTAQFVVNAGGKSPRFESSGKACANVSCLVGHRGAKISSSRNGTNDAGDGIFDVQTGNAAKSVSCSGVHVKIQEHREGDLPDEHCLSSKNINRGKESAPKAAATVMRSGHLEHSASCKAPTATVDSPAKSSTKGVEHVHQCRLKDGVTTSEREEIQERCQYHSNGGDFEAQYGCFGLGNEVVVAEEAQVHKQWS